MIWVYRTTGYSGSFEVGYYDPNNNWVQDSSWGRFQEHEMDDDMARTCARNRVHWLNGGEIEKLK